MKKISCASLRKLLAHGVEFSAEYIGPFCGALSSRRVVAVQTAHHMSSEVLDGPKKGSVVYCDWRGVTVREEDGGYILTDNNVKPPRDFLRISLAAVMECK